MKRKKKEQKTEEIAAEKRGEITKPKKELYILTIINMQIILIYVREIIDLNSERWFSC